MDQSPERKKQKTKEDEEAKEKGTAHKMGKEEKKERKKTSDKRDKVQDTFCTEPDRIYPFVPAYTSRGPLGCPNMIHLHMG